LKIQGPKREKGNTRSVERCLVSGEALRSKVLQG
jgi:hypothetical protein